MREPLWTLGSLAEAAKGELKGAGPATAVTGVSIDSRTLRKGEAFFAITGVRMDGHQFVPDALAAGACVAVISKGEGTPAVVVDDVLQALRDVGAAARERIAHDAPVIAVTGSVGKTGTKELLRLAFGAGGSVHASASSYNNHWGVPLSLARMPAETRAAVFEIGMNHAGEIEPLARLVRPTIAIVTTVAAVHLEFFDSVAAIADAKAEIFSGLEPGGLAVIPADNEHAGRLAAAARRHRAEIITFGNDALADVRLIAFSDDDGWVNASVFGEEVSYAIGEGGRHVAENSLAVLAALHAARRPLGRSVEALAAWKAPRGRGRKVPLTVEGGTALLLDDAYNANPSSVAAAIATLKRQAAGRRIAILGDMLELGVTSDELHRGLAARLVEANVRIVHTVGTMTKHTRDALPPERRGLHAATSEELIAALPEVQPGDAILVKGSLGIGLGSVVNALEERFGPDAEAGSDGGDGGDGSSDA